MIHLINATQHPQAKDAPNWANAGIEFIDPDFVAYEAFSARQPTRAQVINAWRKVLAKLDLSLANGVKVDGFLLGGYPPAVLGLYQYLSQFRQNCVVAVMGPAPMIDGQKRAFVVGGARLLPTPRTMRTEIAREGEALDPEDFDAPSLEGDLVIPKIAREKMRTDRLVHVSARPLTDARRAEIQAVAQVELIASTPALPPPPDHSLEDFKEAIKEIARICVSERCGVLLDGPPAETMLHLYSWIGHQHYFHFLKTEMIARNGEAPKPQIVSLDLVPRF